MSAQWHVLGAGAIGSLFACAMAEAGERPVLLSKRKRSAPQNRTIVRRQTSSGKEDSHSLSFTTSANRATTSIEKLLVTTKAYDVGEAIRQVAHRLNEHSVIIILVNGMGFMPALRQEFPTLKFALGTTTEGAYRIDENNFCHAGVGITRIGQAGLGQAPCWFSSWVNLSLSCDWAANIDEILWQKLAVNCAINPLTAKHHCKNGDLASPEIAAEVKALCDEIAAVSRAEGYNETADGIHQKVQEVIIGTAENKSSMLQDTLAGRRTEIQYISGYLLERCEHHALSAPLNAALYHEIQAFDQLAMSAPVST